MKATAKIGSALILMVGLALAAGTASASMRCGSDVVQEGDTKFALLEACGEPESGNVDLDTGTWFYRIEGKVYEVQIVNDTVEQIRDPQATP